MSLNTAHANNGVLIHAGEAILLFSDNVAMEFVGQDAAVFKGTKTGRIYLTTHRIIFNNKNSKDPLQSFSSPFISMSEVELEQPVFGANYIKGKIRAQQNGNFTGETKFKLLFKSGGCIDFGQALLRAASMAQRNAGGMAPPPYEAPGNGWYAAPPPAYTPHPGSYGWLPQNSAFGQPPTDGVYMSDLPPPYPGINVNQGPGYQINPQNYPGQGPSAFSGQPPQAYSGQGPPAYAPQQFPSVPPYNAPQPNQGGSNSFPAQPPFNSNGPPQQQQQFGGSAPYPGASNSTYPNLPQQPFGFNSPSAPMTKEQEAAASAFYDPRNPNSAYVQNPNPYEMPPAYDQLNNPNNPNNKKTQ